MLLEEPSSEFDNTKDNIIFINHKNKNAKNPYEIDSETNSLHNANGHIQDRLIRTSHDFRSSTGGDKLD